MTSPAPLDHAASTADLLAEADRLAGAGRALQAVDLLHAANVARRDPELEVRLAVLRHQAFGELPTEPGLAEWPLTSDPGESAHIPMIAPSELTAESLVAAIEATGASAIHVHIDLDVLDPAEFSSLGFPEPFGVTVASLLGALRAVTSRFELAGAALCEFAPPSPEAASDDLPTILRIVGALTAESGSA